MDGLYSPGKWHHAIDFSRSDGGTFGVLAASGRVIHIGWDWWSGNTIIVSHDVGGGVKDAYRTVYMHLRNEKIMIAILLGLPQSPSWKDVVIC